ncbi:MAG: RDD family protein, partial [Comamonas sp.]
MPSSVPSSIPAQPALLPPTPGLRRRMACWLYEGLLLFGVVFIAGYLFGTLS